MDKKLIYDYFGSAENLINTYIKSQDYWDNASENSEGLIAETKKDHGKELLTGFLKGQLQTMMSNIELQKIITWEISELQEQLKKLAAEREEQGEILFSSVTKGKCTIVPDVAGSPYFRYLLFKHSQQCERKHFLWH